MSAEEKARWAVRVLDAWAMKHGVMAPAPCFHRFPDGHAWRIFHGVQAVGGHSKHFKTADEARIAAAEKLVAEDPELEPR